MPTIIVRPDGPRDEERGFTLSERVIPSYLHDEHYIDQLVQRLGWALVDAEDQEVAETA
jgi:hypothetical protein